jgi:hypothetical protein
MDRLKQRPSLAKLADRFNTAPPPGYVAGRGRGVSGFAKPDPADLPKVRGARGWHCSVACCLRRPSPYVSRPSPVAPTPQGNIGIQVWVNQGMYEEDGDGADAQEGQAPKKPKRSYKR